jgi:thioredoxin reductase (NADPH)
MRYDVQVRRSEVTRVRALAEGGFAVETGLQSIATRKLLLATGIVDVQPPMERLRTAIQQGHVRLCPVCDGYEVIDKDVAVLGPPDKAVSKALFLRPYTDKLTVLLTPGSALSEQQRTKLARAGIRWKESPVVDLSIEADEVHALLSDGTMHQVDVLYPALGSEVRGALAVALGAECTKDGYVKTDSSQRTSIPGLYAAGDVANELNQICVATGHAAVAATDIYNSLRNGPSHLADSSRVGSV